MATARRNYAPEASIALIGMRGTGLSTLAVMAASALRFGLVDADQHFSRATGLSRVAYKSTYGSDEYRRVETNLLRSMLAENPLRTVIVCGPGAVESTGRTLVADFAQIHPVIYILRDALAIKQYLRAWEVGQIAHLAHLSTPTLRSLSSFEFCNLSDPAQQGHGSGDSSPPSLALKQTEHDFVHLVQSIVTIPKQHETGEAEHRLSAVPVESRAFTYALAVPISISNSYWADVRQTDITADAVELLIPYADFCAEPSKFDHRAADHVSRQYYTLRRNISLPIIIHVHLDHAADPQAVCSNKAYCHLLRHCLRLAPAFMYIYPEYNEDMARDVMAVKGPTKIIASFLDAPLSNTGWNIQKCRKRVNLAKTLGADIVRLCQEASSLDDNFAVRYVVDQLNSSGEEKIPIIAYNTGNLGRASCCFNPVLTNVTDSLVQLYASTEKKNDLLTLQQAQSALYASFLLDPLYFGIYGDNVSKSLSPPMHNAAFRFNGMPHEYRIFQNSTIQALGSLLTDPKLGGISITAPFKSEVIPLVDIMSREARAIGAINTLIPLRTANVASLLDRNKAGRTAAVYGDNTDWIGIESCIRRGLSPINAVKRRTTALVLGAGGMARAAIYALTQLGVRTIFLHNRTLENAQALVKHYERVFKKGSDEKHLDSKTISPNIKILEQKSVAWPENVDFPTIVVSCVATTQIEGKSSVNTSVPSSWLSSPTGGVVIEVSD